MAERPCRDEVLHSLQMIIEACDSVIWRTARACGSRMMSDESFLTASAMDFHVIGYHAGILPQDVRRGSDALEDAYGFRRRMAEGYGLLSEEREYLKRAVSKDVYLIRDHCLKSMRRILKLFRTGRVDRQPPTALR